MPQYYVAIDNELVPPRTRYVCSSVAGYLAAVFDLPKPAVVFLERVPSTEQRGNIHIEDGDLDIEVPAAIVRRAPNTIWLAPAREEQIVRSVAHEIGHIAELLGYVAERGDIEAFPRLLANAVSTTYAAGVGWIDRLLNSHFYFQALAEGPPNPASLRSWNRGDYWRRLQRTRGEFGYLGGGLAASRAGWSTEAWGEAVPNAEPQEERESRRPLLFPVPPRRPEGGDLE